MQALKKRHIRPGHAYDRLVPKSTRKDRVIQPGGKARLHHTINLIKQIVPETVADTRLLAQQLKGEDLPTTCQNIWEFVYHHIQYRRDKAGVEQVRRPSRTWADRKNGVDCDCYSVFISSILTNLDIPHQLRITKYGGKSHFQHIYPIVPTFDKALVGVTPNSNTHITLDCVTDQFDYEVPFSGLKDIDMADPSPVGEIYEGDTVSGVDLADVKWQALGKIDSNAPRLALRQVVPEKSEGGTTKTETFTARPLPHEAMKKEKPVLATSAPGNVKVVGASETTSATRSEVRTVHTGLISKLLIAFGVGLGAYKLTQLLT